MNLTDDDMQLWKEIVSQRFLIIFAQLAKTDTLIL